MQGSVEVESLAQSHLAEGGRGSIETQATWPQGLGSDSFPGAAFLLG